MLKEIAEIFTHIVEILRYIATPFVGISITWFFDKNHRALSTAIKTESPWSLAAIILVGLLIYYAHRILIHPLITRLIERLNLKTDSDALSFARWKRRMSNKPKARAIQSAIDEASAASHFFYCVSLNTALMMICLNLISSDLFEPKFPCWSVVAILVALFLVGFIGDWQTTKWDIKAFNEPS